MSNHNSDHRANSDVNSAAECRLSTSWLVASLLSRVSGVWCLVSTVTHGGRGLACGGAWLLLAGVQMAQGGRAGGDWQWQNPESRAPDSGCEVDGIDKVHRARCTLRGRSERAAFPGPLALQPSGHGDSPLATRVSRLHALGGGREARSAPDAEPLPLPLPVPVPARLGALSPSVSLAFSQLPRGLRQTQGLGATNRRNCQQ